MNELLESSFSCNGIYFLVQICEIEADQVPAISYFHCIFRLKQYLRLKSDFLTFQCFALKAFDLSSDRKKVQKEMRIVNSDDVFLRNQFRQKKIKICKISDFMRIVKCPLDSQIFFLNSGYVPFFLSCFSPLHRNVQLTLFFSFLSITGGVFSVHSHF